MQPAESSHPAHGVWSHFTAEPRVARSLCHECHIFDRHGGAKARASAAVELWQGYMAAFAWPMPLLKQVCGRWQL
jgi:hypothetical protein